MAPSSVIEIPPGQVDEAAWNRLLDSSSLTTPFHSLGWLRALHATYPAWTARVLLVSEGDELRGGLFYVVEKRRPFVRSLASLPFGTYGGPVVRDDAPAEVARSLWDAMRKAAAESRAATVRCVDYHRRWVHAGEPEVEVAHPVLAVVPEGYQSRPSFTQRIRLASDYDQVHRHVYAQNVRKMIRQSGERGVEVERVTGEEGIREYARVARHTLRRKGTPPYPEALYLNLARFMGEQCLYHLARHEGKVVAGVVHLTAGDSVMNWLTSSYREDWNLRPNHALVDTVIRWAVERGLRWYNFGGGPEEDRNLQRYKESWGAERYDYRVWSWDAPLVKWLRRLRGRGE
jgi:CelD/BcsL family acetyltransferase involved in cellulose biosynthesis